MKNNNSEIQALYKAPFPSKRTGALYNAFSYATKISPEAIALFIATHSNPNDEILDTFAGSGTTGLGAILAERPTEEMVQKAKELGLNPKWGPRKVKLYELSVLGSFIANVLTNPPNPVEFKRAFDDFLEKAQEIESAYKVEDPNGDLGVIRHVIWSDSLICSNCSEETLFWKAAVSKDPLKMKKHFTCKSCFTEQEIEKLERVTIKKYDQLLKTCSIQRKRTPVWIYGKTKNTTWDREVTNSDLSLLKQFDKVKFPDNTPIEELNLGDLYRSGYHTGITHLHHLYTNRNFYVMAKLWELADSYTNKTIKSALKFLILSYNATHSTLMTRVVLKKSAKDFVLTSAQSGVLYISSLPVEKNIIEGIKRKFSTIIKSFEITFGARTEVQVFNKSSTNINLADASIDYVFTDPPFGDYIPYSEINQINEFWLGKTTNNKNEVIISKSQNKSVEQYKTLMSKVFGEISRVLSNKGKATVVFHSAKVNVWDALVSSYLKSGMAVVETSVLDKIQSSFKQTVSTVSVKGDPLILLSKSCVGRNNSPDLSECPEHFIKQAKTMEKSVIDAQSTFSAYISYCLKNGFLPKVDANKFYELVSRFNEEGIVIE
ncbi:DNA methylase [Pseudoalteromonas sp. MMG010]|uniref:DNA methyltransferase n=1 Tax=Pseudoalteromonas sp. MMG010 TaxID=2822685 RepID=UPI001B3A5901|nr:DNA methyltransferase [Pseudoalteromonas sp. MMG010]MBQ4832985.1 DNA methylase [Pseudoalteromonas sp. MMG010]